MQVELINVDLNDDDDDDDDARAHDDDAHTHNDDNDADDDDDDADDDDDCCLRVEARAEGGEKTKTSNVWLDLNIILFTIWCIVIIKNIITKSYLDLKIILFTICCTRICMGFWVT